MIELRIRVYGIWALGLTYSAAQARSNHSTHLLSRRKELVMASINTGKVVAGGLLAGLVANAIDFVTNTYILAADWQAWAPSRNLDPARDDAAQRRGHVDRDRLPLRHPARLDVCGDASAVRPGAKTAILAGLVIYLAATLVLFGFTHDGHADDDARS